MHEHQKYIALHPPHCRTCPSRPFGIRLAVVQCSFSASNIHINRNACMATFILNGVWSGRRWRCWRWWWCGEAVVVVLVTISIGHKHARKCLYTTHRLCGVDARPTPVRAHIDRMRMCLNYQPYRIINIRSTKSRVDKAMQHMLHW